MDWIHGEMWMLIRFSLKKKTSTGFASSGATYEDIELMRANVSDHIEVKASGGIKTLDQVLEFLRKGATRIGSSSTAQILEDFKKQQKN